MQAKTVSNLVWVNPEHTAFDCTVVWEGSDTAYPFACNQIEVGVLPYVTTIWNSAMAGEYGVIAEYVPPPEYSTEVQPNQPVVTGAQTL